MNLEKEHRAMKHSLHRAARAGVKCAAESCNKVSVIGSDYCAHHRNLRVEIKKHDDLNVYGASS